ncbi:MAG: choice-of-anchor D domain-containing protein [Bacteriovoracaceae bacterium]|jgi:hypothetical protein|nr:choice-of-anchor D domain-containing protein [Bacteriovoracaceae bacterium]
MDALQKKEVVTYKGVALADLELDSSTVPLSMGEIVLNERIDFQVILVNTGKNEVLSADFTSFKTASEIDYAGGDFPGTGGSCELPLAGGDKCYINFSFTPKTPGSFSYKFNYNFANGIEIVEKSINIFGYAGTVAKLEIDYPSLNFGTNELNTPKVLRAVISNTGGLTASSFSSSLATANEFQLVANTCSSTIRAGKSCYIDVSFSSAASNLFSDTFNYSYNNVSTTLNEALALSGFTTSIEANLVFESNSKKYIYGSITNNSTSSRSITIKNNGYANASFTSINFSDGSYSANSASSCLSAPLAPQSTCDLLVDFNPTSLGDFSSDFNIIYESGKGPKILDHKVYFSVTEPFLEGSSHNPAILEFSSSSYDFGVLGVNDIKTTTLYLSNIGESYATQVDSIASMIEPPFYIENTNCQSPFYMPNLSYCSILISYRPTVAGVTSQNINFEYFDGASNQSATMTLMGDAQNLAILNFASSADIDFGTVLHTSESLPQTITIENVGSGAASSLVDNFSSMPDTSFYYKSSSALSPGTYPGDGGTCNPSGTLAAGSSCTIVLASSATHGSGEIFDLEYTYFDGNGTRTTKDKRLKVIHDYPAVVALSPGSSIHTDFSGLIGHLAIGETRKVVFRVSHKTGTMDATISALNLNYPTTNNPFTYVGGGQDECSPSLPFTLSKANSSSFCVLTFSVNPTVSGSHIMNVDIVYDDGTGSTQTNSTNLEVIAGNYAYLEATTDFYSISAVKGGATVDVVYEITNNGSANATALNVDFGELASRHYSFDTATVPGTRCKDISTLGIGLKCYISLTFSPNTSGPLGFSSTGVSNFWGGSGFEDVSEYFGVSYRNGVVFNDLDGDTSNDNYDYQILGLEVEATGYTPSLVTFKNTILELDLGEVIVDTTKSDDFILKNGGTYPATLTFSFAGDPGFSSSSVTIPGGEQLNINVSFSPTAINLGGESTSTMTISYFDGITTQNLTLDLKGTADPPYIPHKGWSNIYAVGAHGGNPLEVKFSWDDMDGSGGYTIDTYHVYRRKAHEDYDFSTSLNQQVGTYIITDSNSIDPIQYDAASIIIDVDSRTLIDKTAIGLQDYYYYVKPVITGFWSGSGPSRIDYPSKTTGLNITELRVAAPGNNMSLLHRWTVNQYVCFEIFSKGFDKNNHYRCSGLIGSGLEDSVYDFGKDLHVDSYEVGADYTNSPGQLPNSNLGQQDLWDLCNGQSISLTSSNDGQTEVINNISSEVMSVIEYNIASAWPSAFSQTDINNTENSTSTGTNCNNGSVVENTGVNTSCKSRFGIYDLVGNAPEWTRDRMFLADGNIGSGKLVSTDNHLDSISYVSFNGDEDSIDSFTCFSKLLQMPVEDDGTGNCNLGDLLSSSLNTNLVSHAYFTSPGAGASALMVGGSHLSDSRENSSRLTKVWAAPGQRIGGRCSVSIPYYDNLN